MNLLGKDIVLYITKSNIKYIINIMAEEKKKGDPEGYKCWMGFAPKAKKYYRVCKTLEELDAIKKKTAKKMMGKLKEEAPADMSKALSSRIMKSKDLTTKEKKDILGAVKDKKEIVRELKKMEGKPEKAKKQRIAVQQDDPKDIIGKMVKDAKPEPKPKKKKKMKVIGIEWDSESEDEIEKSLQADHAEVLKDEIAAKIRARARAKVAQKETKAGEMSQEKKDEIAFKERFDGFKAKFRKEAEVEGYFAEPIKSGGQVVAYGSIDQDAMGKFIDLYFKLNRENAKMPKLSKGEFKKFKRDAIHWLMKQGAKIEYPPPKDFNVTGNLADAIRDDNDILNDEINAIMSALDPEDLDMEMLSDFLYAYQSDDGPQYQVELGDREVDPQSINELGAVFWEILGGMMKNTIDFDMIVKQNKSGLKKFFKKS
jgi:outer membrane biosynthesis protein TonB